MARVLRYDASEVPAAIAEALETGQTMVFPTDTVYGIGGNPWDERTLARVRDIKGRDATQPLALLLGSVAAAERFTRLDARLRALVARLLPGPYTLLVPAGTEAPPASVRDGVVGLRVPDHPLFTRTLAALGRPLFGTSVNRRGEPPLHDIEEIIDRFPGVDLILYGPTGRSPSTILDLTARTTRVVRGELSSAARAILQEEQDGDPSDGEERPRNGA